MKTGFVSELCQMTAETPITQCDLRGHAEARRCCEKSLTGTALLRFGVRYCGCVADRFGQLFSELFSNQVRVQARKTTGRQGAQPLYSIVPAPAPPKPEAACWLPDS